jgi:hypothetical protein
MSPSLPPWATPPPGVLCHLSLGCVGPSCVVLRLMAQDDDQQVAEAIEFWQKLKVMVTAADDAKKAVVVRTWVLVAVAILEEEQRTIVAHDEVDMLYIVILTGPLV